MTHRRTTHMAARPQRGLAATAAALLLFFAMGIIVAFTNRSLIFEQRTSANQYRYTKAFEAAEAGLEWTIASLNNKLKIDTACAPDATGAGSFKERYTTTNTTTGVITANALNPVCVIAAGGYSCSCPTAGNATVGATGPAFKVEFSSVAQAGVVRVTVHGCTSPDGNCAPGGAGTPDGYAKVTALLGALPALSTAPAATITAKTTVSWAGSGAALGVVNSDPSTNGITINAGGAITPGSARITTIPGSPPLSSIIQNDPSLANITTDSMFVTFFGMTKADFKALALNVTCPGNCGATLTTAIASLGTTSRMIWVEGNMDVQGNVALGDTTSPVMLVVNGNIHLNGTMDVTGLVYSSNSDWNNTGGGSAFIRGAAITEGSFTGNGSPDFYFDAGVLQTFRTVPGAFTKIPGSWKDY